MSAGPVCLPRCAGTERNDRRHALPMPIHRTGPAATSNESNPHLASPLLVGRLRRKRGPLARLRPPEARRPAELRWPSRVGRREDDCGTLGLARELEKPGAGFRPEAWSCEHEYLTEA